MNSPNQSRKTKRKNNKREEWAQRFYDPTILWMGVAENAPHRALLVSNTSGKFQLHTKDFSTGREFQLTKKNHGQLFGSLSPDGNFVFYLDDRGGKEHGHFVRVPFSGGKSVDITPALPEYYSYSVSVSDDGKVASFFCSVGSKNKVYLVLFGSAYEPIETQTIYETEANILSVIMSPDGAQSCVSVVSKSTTESSEVLFVDNRTSRILSRQKLNGVFVPLSFSRQPATLRILGLSSTRGGYRPVFLDQESGNRVTLDNSKFRGDVFILSWMEKTGKLFLCETHEARQKLFLYDQKTREAKQIGPTTGNFDLFFNALGRLRGGALLARWDSFGTPSRILKLVPPDYKMDPSDNKIKNDSAPLLQSIEFFSSDRTMVQMWVARPRVKTKQPKFIIDIHGGPHGVSGDYFSPDALAWLEQGFGYCSVNYRGSIGFGKKFKQKIYGNPGHWEVKDVVAARNWLVKKGWADPKGIVLSGWSWGGYVALLALGKYPDLWAGGIAGVPITDFFIQYEDEVAFFKAEDRKRFGGTPQEVPHKYARSSPATYASRIKAPTLIIYGENDVRCPPRQIEAFKKLLKGKKILTTRKFLSGHAGGFSDVKIRVANVRTSLEFAKKIDVKRRTPPKS